MIRIFCGYDKREAVGFHVFVESLIRHTDSAVAIIPLIGEQRDGTNAYTYARFLVPYLCNFEGSAIFVDGSDMLLRTDIKQLAKLANSQYAVQVVRHDYRTHHPRKYLGTTMESPNSDYPRKNWSSVMIWNCGYAANRWLTPKAIGDSEGAFLHRFGWLDSEEIGPLPVRWNALIGEQKAPDPHIAHFTLGIPAIDAYQESDFAEEWRAMARLGQTAPERINV